ncbi:MAG: cytochrome c biogenesis protein CcsA [Alphaproteobacteria bacterium]|nr:cytochrome c biogenesis protein CcsA [Alphaproteobacteria bacterium]
MGNSLLFGISALISLAPATIVAYRRDPGPDVLFWSSCLVGVLGPLTLVVGLYAGHWPTDLSASLWMTIALCMSFFTGLCVVQPGAWRVAPLLTPYVVILGLIATASGQSPSHMLLTGGASLWVKAHILISVATYALVTLAALYGLAVLLQERALKSRHRTRLTGLLPSVMDAERLQVRLLVVSEIILGAGLATGFVSQILVTGGWVGLDHKIIFAIGAFLVIGALLAAHFRTGIRGRRVARLALLAYLFITLGYPGVKFVTDILIG